MDDVHACELPGTWMALRAPVQARIITMVQDHADTLVGRLGFRAMMFATMSFFGCKEDASFEQLLKQSCGSSKALRKEWRANLISNSNAEVKERAEDLNVLVRACPRMGALSPRHCRFAVFCVATPHGLRCSSHWSPGTSLMCVRLSRSTALSSAWKRSPVC